MRPYGYKLIIAQVNEEEGTVFLPESSTQSTWQA